MYITWNSTTLHLFSYLSHTLPNFSNHIHYLTSNFVSNEVTYDSLDLVSLFFMVQQNIH